MSTTMAVKERPILFRDEMVKAILEGRKSMTRRIVKPQPPHGYEPHIASDFASAKFRNGYAPWTPSRHHGVVGDRLWVRETWAISGHHKDGPRYEFRAAPADGECHRSVGRWKPSIHMPRAACRLVLEITGVRVERLNDISEEDAIEEGVSYTGPYPAAVACGFLPRAEDLARRGYRKLWEAINGVGSWAENPFVWVVSFRRVDQ